jgi:uncharacterized integral membrane protein
VADPHHVEALDSFDVATVSLYRTGIAVSALGVGLVAAAHWTGRPDGLARLVLLGGVALVDAHLHLYDKRIRWVIVASGWAAAVLLFSGLLTGNGWVGDAGLGFAFVVQSGVALKERFCFRLPFMNAVPWLLASALVPLRLGLDRPAAALLAGGATLVGLLAIAKARMPLHFDIGDRRRYQV